MVLSHVLALGLPKAIEMHRLADDSDSSCTASLRLQHMNMSPWSRHHGQRLSAFVDDAGAICFVVLE